MPKNDQAPAVVTSPGVVADLSSMTVADLRSELVRSLKLTAAHLLRLASIVRELEERGEDLSDIKVGMMGHLRRIAYGQVMPELVVRYAESPGLLKTLSSLPLPDQARIAAGEPVRVVVRRENGKFDSRLMDPIKLDRSQVAQVFGRGEIRDEAGQIMILEGRAASAASPSKFATMRRGIVRPDPEKRGLMVGNKLIPTGAIVSALAEIRGDIDGSPAEVSVGIKLTESEHVSLKNAANRAGVSMNVLVRRALMLHGLFSGE